MNLTEEQKSIRRYFLADKRRGMVLRKILESTDYTKGELLNLLTYQPKLHAQVVTINIALLKQLLGEEDAS
ncbi:hypothetical protein [[Eubacterium] cellulosolvens]